MDEKGAVAETARPVLGWGPCPWGTGLHRTR
jgi:hypothetical protein